MNRRQFLRGALGTAVAMPLLSALPGSARAIPTTAPKRLLVFFTPHGTMHEQWKITGGEHDFTLGGVLAPLEPHKKDLIFLRNVDMHSAGYGPGDTHQEGMSALLSGTALLEDPAGSGGLRMDTQKPIGWGGGTSIDQFLAKPLPGQSGTKFPSLELGVMSTFNAVGGRISYREPGKPVPPVNDPRLVFDRLFGDFGADPLGVEQLRKDRKSVLDAVRDQFARAHKHASAEDRLKLESHAEIVRDIEVRLTTATASFGASCKKPGAPAVNSGDVNHYPAIGKLQIDLMLMAFACDLTRVGSIMYSHAGGTPTSPWLGIPEGHHELSHAGRSDTGARQKLANVKRWYSEQFAYLLDAMKKIPEGTGTMLDNTVVFWGSELAEGDTHSHDDMPFVLAGSCGGYFQTGRHVTYARDTMVSGKLRGVSHNDLLVSLCHAMGRTDVMTYGNPAYCRGGPLPRLAV